MNEAEPTTRHLLVDGSNVLQAWRDTRALARKDREAAKSQVLRRIGRWHDLEKLRVTVVFDGRGSELTIEAVGGAETFACVHTPAGMTADAVIERLVCRAEDAGRCLVVTADRAERATVEAAGAAVCDPDELAARLEAIEARYVRVVKRVNQAAGTAWRAPQGGGL